MIITQELFGWLVRTMIFQLAAEMQQIQSVSAGEGFIIFCSRKQKGWNMTTCTLRTASRAFISPGDAAITYPQAWMAHYQTENYLAIDPVLRKENFLRGHLPWNDKLFHDTPELWDGARDHGLRVRHGA